jgi:hypothetical protein
MVTKRLACTHVALGICVALALVGVAGCERAGTGPTSPSQPPAQPPPPSPPQAPTSLEFSLSGVAFDNVGKPLPDVRVEVIDGPGLGVFALTNASGEYALPGVFSDTIAVRATKAGYVTETQTFPFSRPWPSGHFELHFSLDTPSVNLAGDYTLTVAADPACSEFPPQARSRTYLSTVTPSPYLSNGYVVTLSGATFFPNNNTINAVVAGDSARFDIDPYSDMVVTEALTGSAALTFWGTSSATVGAPSISAPFAGTVEYCPNALGRQGTFPFIRCGVPPVDCVSSNHRLTVTRQ